MRQIQIQRQFQVTDKEIQVVKEIFGFSEKEINTTIDIGLSFKQVENIGKGNTELGLSREDLSISDNIIKNKLKDAINQLNNTEKELRSFLQVNRLPNFRMEKITEKLSNKSLILSEETTNLIRDMSKSYNDAKQKIKTAIDEIRDPKEIDKNELIILRKAQKLNLFDKIVSEKLYIEAIQGTINKYLLEEIKEVQKALKADGKYSGEIDGKWGMASREGLKELILENAEALIIDSKQLKQEQKLNREKSLIIPGRNY